MRFALNAMMIRLANNASPITPFEKTSRSPRFMNWRGMNRSRARIADRRGKSWYAVFAARMRIEAVKNDRT